MSSTSKEWHCEEVQYKCFILDKEYSAPAGAQALEKDAHCSRRECIRNLAQWTSGLAASILFGKNTQAKQDLNEGILVDYVDLIEINHFYDDQGRLILDQVIFYDWNQRYSRYDIVAWRLMKKEHQKPQFDYKKGILTAIWHDGDIMRKVHARQKREAWTQSDPELVAQKELPKEKRRELRMPRQR